MDIVRASERQHPVQRSGSDGNLGRFGLVGARSKRIADHALLSADRRLDLGPQIVAAGFLPGHAAAFGDHPQMTVTLCRGGPRRRTRVNRPLSDSRGLFYAFPAALLEFCKALENVSGV